MKRFLFITGISIISATAAAQDSSHTRLLSISGYAEIYYQYDFNKPMNGNRPSFIYSHNRHNEFNLNLGFIKAAYATGKVRANLALAAGTYMNANYAAEPSALKPIFEANAGIKLSKKKNLWLDAGILPSHIGFESAVSKESPTLTRSLGAENSPYFEAGAKLTFTTDNGKWILSCLALNGWQRISRLSGNSLMSWGTQIQFKPSGKTLLNYSTFIGTDKPDSARLYRFFHNIYGIFTISEKLGVTVGFDIGSEEKTSASRSSNTWYSPVVIIKYFISNQWAIAGRAEYYQDRKGVIIATGTANGFQTTGYSLNIDYVTGKNMLLRLEGRNLRSSDRIFFKSNNPVKTDMFFTGSVAVSF
ncbi:MAG TPA: porin [Chitinophagaceae bacterium]